MKLKTKDFLTLSELSPKEFLNLIDFSIKLKKTSIKPLLKNKSLTMIFQKPSTRTRVSFEIAMFQLGGHAVNLSSNEMQLSRGESIEDTAKTLSRYTDCIMARVYDHSLLEHLSAHSTVPVINGLSDSFHPCQILADFMTIKERKGKINDLKIAWIGDGNNVCHSMIYGCALSKSSMFIATPKGFEPDKKVVKEGSNHTEIVVTNDPKFAVSDADVVVSDTFTSIHNRDLKRKKQFLPKYQVNQTLMENAKSDSIFMHCLPAKREEEVTSSVIDGSQSVVWDEAENRLHTQKALLASLIRA
ncbi:MAG: ornithine carbamoyltransferase [Nitrosarchaeum sp.]|nr:ornithine carbamoyltransferase [Nitrosarchaeum sp.]